MLIRIYYIEVIHVNFFGSPCILDWGPHVMVRVKLAEVF